MVNVGIVALLEAKPGKEEELASLLKGAVDLARAEAGTVTWYAFRAGPTSFGIFDTFNDAGGRDAHMAGRIAAALMAKAPELLAQPPDLRNVDILAQK